MDKIREAAEEVWKQAHLNEHDSRFENSRQNMSKKPGDFEDALDIEYEDLYDLLPILSAENAFDLDPGDEYAIESLTPATPLGRSWDGEEDFILKRGDEYYLIDTQGTNRCIYVGHLTNVPVGLGESKISDAATP